MVSDLKREDQLENWRETTQDRGAWRWLVEDAMADINAWAEVREER